MPINTNTKFTDMVPLATDGIGTFIPDAIRATAQKYR